MPTTISYNPFKHMVNGAKKVFQTNLISLILLMLAQIILMVIMAIGLVASLFVAVGQKSLSSALPPAIVVGLIIVLVSVLLNLVLNRIILTGVRRQKTSLGSALGLSIKRLGLTVLMGLAIIVAFVLPLLAAGFIGKAIGDMGLLLALGLGVVIIVVMIVMLPTLLMIPFVLVDDQKPSGIKAVFKQAEATAAVVKGRLWVLIITIIPIALVLSALSGDSGSWRDVNQSSSGWGWISDLIMIVFSVVAEAALAELYILAQGQRKLDVTVPTDSGAAQVQS